jgi:hypothetical protein
MNVRGKREEGESYFVGSVSDKRNSVPVKFMFWKEFEAEAEVPAEVTEEAREGLSAPWIG